MVTVTVMAIVRLLLLHGEVIHRDCAVLPAGFCTYAIAPG
jgi:hypothetical protein